MSNARKKIVFTGGGTAGHVTPNIALINKFKSADWQTFYIGSKSGIEKDLIGKLKIPYFSVANGKLRRYFSWQNFVDPFKVLYGIMQACLLLWKIKPAVIFSKGGFVSLPVVIAAWINRIPTFIHESDLTPGLANKLCFPFAAKIFVTFSQTANYFANQDKVMIVGTPVRNELLHGNAQTGRALCGFTPDKKTILAFGGSMGADVINNLVRQLLPRLLTKFQLVHICGKGKIDKSLENQVGYKQFEYLNEDFPHVIAAADLVIARGGANSIYEFLILRKPHILIPLGAHSSRGDQIENAEYFATLGFSEVLFEEEATVQGLQNKISKINAHCEEIKEKLGKFIIFDSAGIIYKTLSDYA